MMRQMPAGRWTKTAVRARLGTMVSSSTSSTTGVQVKHISKLMMPYIETGTTLLHLAGDNATCFAAARRYNGWTQFS